MRTVTVEIEGLTPYSSSKHFEEALEKGETKDAHEKRRWREKAHVNKDGYVYIPGVAFKMCLDEIAKLLNEKIPGKRNQTWSKQFATGITAMTDVDLGIKVDDLVSIELFVNSDGKRGSGSRVMKYFPIIPNWKGKLEMTVFNDTIPEEIFERFFVQAGILIGVGRGRPITGCAAGNGRFKPVKFTWSN